MKRPPVLLLVVGLLTACGGSATPAPASPPTSASSTAAQASSAAPASAGASSTAAKPSASASAAAPAAPKPTGDLIIGTPLNKVSLDPHVGSSPPEFQTMYPAFDALVEIDANGQPVPALALS